MRSSICSSFIALLGACSEAPAAMVPQAQAGMAGTMASAGAGGGGAAEGGMPNASGSDSGGASGAAGAAGAGGAGGAGGSAGQTAVELLSTTGLFTSIDGSGALVLSPGVLAYEPRYKLWSDSADKARWIQLPAGSKIDTSDPDHWKFPIGTKFWKEFAVNGARVETRLIERVDDAAKPFRYRTFWWKTPADAELVPEKDNVRDANGTDHDIPFGQNCERCHDGLSDRVLGFGALQLAHDLPGVSLTTLANDGWLSDALPADIGFPGDQVAQDALGYLHANCSNCHNDSPGIPLDALPAPQMYLRVLVGDKTVEATGAYQSALNVAVSRPEELGIPLRITGGDHEQSAIWYRMSLRFTESQMPPLATDETDPAGLAAVSAWITTLPPPEPQQ